MRFPSILLLLLGFLQLVWESHLPFLSVFLYCSSNRCSCLIVACLIFKWRISGTYYFHQVSSSSLYVVEDDSQIIIFNDRVLQWISHFCSKVMWTGWYRDGKIVYTLRILIQVPFLLSLFILSHSLSLALSPRDIIHFFLNSLIYILFSFLSFFFFPASQQLKGPTTRFPHHKIRPYSFLYLHSSFFFIAVSWRFAAAKRNSSSEPRLLSYSFSHSHSVHRLFSSFIWVSFFLPV